MPENDGNDDDRRKRKGIFRMLITAGILVVLIGGILAVRTIRKPVDNGEPSYTDSDDSDALNKGNFGTADNSDKSFAQAMETIRDHATTIENALDSYRREGTEGIACAFITDQEKSPKYLYIPAVPQMAFMRNIFTGASRCFILMYGTEMRSSIFIIRTAF